MDLNEVNMDESQVWDKPDGDFNFFGETPKTFTDATTVVEEVEKDDLKPKDKKDKESSTTGDAEDVDEKKEPEFDFGFEKPDTITEGTVENGETGESLEIEEPTSIYSGTLDFLSEVGLIEVSEEEIKDLSDEDIKDLISDKFSQNVEKNVEEKIADLPPVVKQLIRLAINNGDIEEALSQLASSRSTGVTTTMDIEDETNQEKMVRQYLLDQDFDEEDIDSQIEFFKDSGKLSSAAKKYFSKWKTDEEAYQKDLIDQRNKQIQIAKQNQSDFKKEVKSHLVENKEIKDFTITKEDAKILPDYISNPSIKMQNGSSVTPFWNDLMEAMKDKDNLVIMAKLVKSNFDFKDIVKKSETKATRNIKEEIHRQEKSKNVRTGGGSSQSKRLIDLI